MVLQFDPDGVFSRIVGSFAAEALRGWISPLRATCNCGCPWIGVLPGSHTSDSCSCVCPALELGPLVEVLGGFGSYGSINLLAALIGFLRHGPAHH